MLQAQLAPGRPRPAGATHGLGERYWDADNAMRADWAKELDLPARAMRAEAPAAAANLASRCLAQRDLR